MIKHIFKYATCSVLAFSLVLSPIFNYEVLNRFNIDSIDIVSHASSVAPPPTPSLIPGKGGSVDKGEPISEEDKNLMYESDLITDVRYNNEYGYLILDINQDFLEGGFVNRIKSIGINDTKYKYATVNSDRSRWFTIYIPYKYLNEGENDLYFYMGDITYKTFVNLDSEEFHKERIAPKLIPQENTDGVDVEFKLDIVHNSEEDRQAFYAAVRDNLKKNTTMTEVFTYGSLETEISKDNYDVFIDEANDVLTIKFKNGKTIYQALYVYLIDIEAEGFTTARGTIILYEHAEPLKTEWQTSGDKSLKISYNGEHNSIYLGEVKSVELELLDDNGKKVEEKTLKKDIDYTATWSELFIKPEVFKSNSKYKVSLIHPSVKTVTLDVDSPELDAVQPAKNIYLDDINDDEDLVVSFKPEDKEWVDKISEIVFYDRQSKQYVMKPLSQKAQDDADNDYDGYYRENPNKYYTLDREALTLTIDKSNFTNGTGRHSLVIKSDGYRDTSTSFYRKIKNPGAWDAKAPELKYEFLTNEDSSLQLICEEEPMHSMLRTYYERRTKEPSAESTLVLKNNTTGEIKTLTVGEDEDFWSYYADGGYKLKIFAKNFSTGNEYTLTLKHRQYPSVVIRDIKLPASFNSELKQAEISVASIMQGQPLVVKADADFIQKVSAVKLVGPRGHNTTVKEGFEKNGDTLTLPVAEIIEDGNIPESTGVFTITVKAKGYKDAQAGFIIKTDNITAEANTAIYYNKMSIAFYKENLPEYGFADSVTEVILNGDKLSNTQFMREPLGNALSINERLLLDGQNNIKIKSSKYNDTEVDFTFDNKKLREEKEKLLEKLNNPENTKNLSEAQIADLRNKINEAKTLRFLRSLEIDMTVSTLGAEKAKNKLKEDLLKAVAEAELSEEVKADLIEKINKADNLNEVKQLSEKINEEVANSAKAKEKAFEDTKSSLIKAIEESTLAEADKAALKAELESLTPEKLKEFTKKLEEAIDSKRIEDAQNNNSGNMIDDKEDSNTDNQADEQIDNKDDNSDNKPDNNNGSNNDEEKDDKSGYNNRNSGSRGSGGGAARAAVNKPLENKEGWKKLPDGKWNYLIENQPVKSSWIQEGGKWFRFDENGVLIEDKWILVENNWFFAKKDGYIAESEWISVDGKWYYAKKDGYIAVSSWENINDKWYHFEASGALSVNTTVDGYKVDENGARL